jgi:hypothetical protein
VIAIAGYQNYFSVQTRPNGARIYPYEKVWYGLYPGVDAVFTEPGTVEWDSWWRLASTLA